MLSTGMSRHFRAALVIRHEMGDRVAMATTLIGMASVHLADRRQDGAATLLGMVESLIRRAGAVLPPHDESERARCMNEIRTSLDAAAGRAAVEAGRSMTEAQAIAEALESRRG